MLPKKEYVCHNENLRTYVKLGGKLTKVHNGVKFEQKKWLKSYIDLNTELGAKATNEADKNMYKLINNAVFGKTCENLFETTKFELVSTRDRGLKLIAKPQFKSYTIYNEKLVGKLLEPPKVKLDKPSYVGVSILDISKIYMYDFHYNDVKARYGNRTTLNFTDTDSLCYTFETDDWYDDIRDDVPTKYDTSAYLKNHPSGLPKINKK